MSDAETFRHSTKVGNVERDQPGSPGGQGVAALAARVGLAAGDHRQKLIRSRGGLLDRGRAECSARASHDRRQPGEAVAVADPGDSAPKVSI
jgi:hypothetical protein